MKLYIVLLLLFCSEFACGQIIRTVAGDGVLGAAFNGDYGPATAAEIGACGFIAFDNSGNCYFTDGQLTIRRIDISGTITTIAGTGSSGCTGNGGMATDAEILPSSIAIDKMNNLYFSDIGCNQIRKINLNTGIVENYAGTGVVGFSGDSGLATNAKINTPFGITVDTFGNVYFVDVSNNRIRVIDTNGYIFTYAGNGINLNGGDSGLATNASFAELTGICCDNNNNLIICAGSKLRKINKSTNIVYSIAGNGLLTDGHDADSAAVSTNFVCVDRAGNIFFSETGDDIREIDVTGIIHTICGNPSTAGYNGDDILADTAELNKPLGLTVDTCGSLFICDHFNYRVRKITFDSCVRPPTNINYLTNSYIYNAVAIFPNPTSSILSIKCVTSFSNVAIYSLDGRAIATKAVDGTQAEINVSKLPTGLYFVQVDGVMAGKFIKE